ncbi:aldo/keto reductase [Desertibacillus haloalkaliphilus]|uniref:aldo/keto reductase n=1 Tax=Desertibacillus haloalkaliphilus TaxID=1328930 RepID=UPI001C2714B4|nr:aldo/keto reductase [Desertibacillus haloalkaliphilus]MBU8907997.1 aldo/keto reductase [Desertibacillus haloalkaliphilus]
MKKNRLGSSELYVSEIGLGCMSFTSENEKNSIKMIEAAIEQGVNFLDTADLYEFGQNEELVAKSIKGKRDQVILATKVGNRPYGGGKEGWYWDPSKAYIKEAVKGSLKRLQTDYIDLYQLHGGTIDDPIEETIEAFEELKQEGLIRSYGISSLRPNVIREYVNHSSIDSVMMPYSIIDQRPEEEMLNFLHNNHVSVIARGPLSKGMLTEKWRNKLPNEEYLEYSPSELKELITYLESEVRHNIGLTQLGLRYALTHPAVATVIPGASRLEQLQDNLKAKDVANLTAEQLRSIKEHTKRNTYKLHR